MTDIGPRIAYFSMEIGLQSEMPTYAGGLGVLAGDTLRAAADLGLPIVAVTLVHREGYFRQRLTEDGGQIEEPQAWAVERTLVERPERVTVTIEGRLVQVRSWEYVVQGLGGRVPVYLLDTDVPENAEADRTLTGRLYGGDARYRLSQELVLGVGGVRMLRAVGHGHIERFHLNEGHSSLLIVELLAERTRAAERTAIMPEDIADVRGRCVFTTHTPVPAGHDHFPLELVRHVLGESPLYDLKERCCFGGELNLTYLALNFSHYVNGVAMRHGEVSRRMFGGYVIDAITNGVHAATWVSDGFRALFDRCIPGWQRDNFSLRYATGLELDDIWTAHMEAKRALIDHVRRDSGLRLDPEVLTLGFARRAAAYKRADLVLQQPGRLAQIAATAGPVQLVFAGKAHPRDDEGKRMIERVVTGMKALGGLVVGTYLPNYDVALARLVTAGADLWLNTPLPPLEASGTSGMKAALNGVPSFSVLDGWWIEGHIEGVTGWAIDGQGIDRSADAAVLYDKLERVILPLFYRDRDRYIEVMRQAIALNGSFFTSQRMLQEYTLKAYV
jgi:starch phosphorylase